MSDEMKEFLDKVDKLCYEYKFEIKPTYPVTDEKSLYIFLVVMELSRNSLDEN
jgi:hypothetical protein